MKIASRSRLVLALLVPCVAAANAKEARKIKVPSPEALAPIQIPSLIAAQSSFAPELIAVCGALTDKKGPDGKIIEKKGPDAARGSFQPRDLTSADSRVAAVAKLKWTCNLLGNGMPLAASDLENLRAFRADPSGARASVAIVLNEPTATPQGTVSGAPASLEAAILNGLANFIYNRAKEEAEVYLARQLSQVLCADDMRPYFETLCVVFANPDPKISLAAMGSYLGTAARTDLERFPDVALVYGLTQLDDQNDAAGTAREILFGARLGLAYYRAVSAGRAPLDVARSLHGIGPTTDAPSRRVLAAVGFASAVVDAVTRQKGWETLTPNAPPITLSAYALGVLFTVDDIDAAKPFSKVDLQVLSANVPVLVQFVLDVAALNGRITRAIAASMASADGGGGFENAGPASRPSRSDVAVATTQLLDRTLGQALVLAQAFGFMDEKTAAPFGHVRAVLQFGERVIAGDPAGAVLMTATELHTLDRSIQASGTVVSPAALRFAPFVAQLAQAKSADDVNTVLQAAAAPPTSYENKYKGRTVAVNALVGVAAGGEGVQNAGLKWGGFAGAFAPVGMHATIPLGDSFHLGGFVSVINIGALVSARFGSDTLSNTEKVQSDPNVSLANVLSPGAFVTLGLFRSPFVVGAGVQAVPAARRLQSTDTSGTHTSSAAGLQVFGFLSVDVPIFLF